MRRRLAVLVAAVTAMVAIAFSLPLAVVVRVVARDRALSAADQESLTVAGVLAALDDPAEIGAVLEQVRADSPRDVAVVLPDGEVVGDDVVVPADELALARTGRSFTAGDDAARRVLVPVRNADDSVTVAVVTVPGSLLRQGVVPAWLALGSVALALVLVATALADRLARGLVVSVEDLGAVTARLQRGERTARVEPGGPREIEAVGQTINALADRIDELVATERETLADLSHRLRTPLAGLALEAGNVADEDDRRRLQSSVDRMGKEVDELIRAARAPGGERTELIDAGEVVLERLEFWSALAEDEDRSWSSDVPDAVVPVRVDRAHLAAAVDALVGNVLAHTEPGTGFRVGLRVDGRVAVLTVEDDGPGLPAGALERGASAAGSTGLGLDIARRAAESTGGSLDAGPAPGGGARVELRLGRSPC